MRCRILHDSPGRLRVHIPREELSFHEADLLEYYLKDLPGIDDVQVNERTCTAVIVYHSARDGIVTALSRFSFRTSEAAVPERTGRELSREFEDRVIVHTLRRAMELVFLPAAVRNAVTVFRSRKFILAGLASLWKGRLEVSVLDAVTITVSMLRREFSTAGNIMFLLGLSEILEEWTHKKSVDDLARSLSLNIDKVWLVPENGTDVLVSVSDVREGDLIRVGTGNMVPLDGTVLSGEASVNQASLTGESAPVTKAEGSYVYAGTVLEEGELLVQVKQTNGTGRYDRIVRMIEDSQKLRSDTENRAAMMAERLVPWSLGLTALTWAFTGTVERALAVLMVDYSCALKLSIPIAVLSAIREASDCGIQVKGGKYMEKTALADTLVFDKTGTLTTSEPKVAQIITFGGNDEVEMLRLAACLEEHFPHSVAAAVVKEAEDRGITHDEMHSKVDYVIAHGIKSHVGRRKVLIGSYHFVFEDEKCRIPADEKEKFDAVPPGYSYLYLAVSGKLAAVICIEDPLRRETPQTVQRLHEHGIKRIVMLTGDSRRTAEAISAKAGITEYQAEMLPEDKALYIRNARAQGNCVVMIGDGVNDTPALSEADVAVAVSNGAHIAREIADITIADDISKLVVLRDLSTLLNERIHRLYRSILLFNSGLIVLGVAGMLPAATTAWLHNLSTLSLSLYSMTDLQ